MDKEIYSQMCSIVGSDNAAVDVPMKKHTTFRVGGNADYFINPHTIDEISQIIDVCKKGKIPYYILGNGSNLLVSDDGYRGAVIRIYKNISSITIEENIVRAEAGALLSRIAAKTAETSLTGFEFASGIPGTIGGAVVMNAGAYGGELKDIILSATVLNDSGQVVRLSKEDLELGYRTSVISRNHYIALSAELELKKGNKEQISARMEELQVARSAKQPLEYGSAGSTFKRPQGYFAGKLIMESGLRGYCLGDAQVSEKHCGFVINRGSASASEIYQLILYVVREVDEKFHVKLEPEVKMIGKF